MRVERNLGRKRIRGNQTFLGRYPLVSLKRKGLSQNQALYVRIAKTTSRKETDGEGENWGGKPGKVESENTIRINIFSGSDALGVLAG